MTQPYIQPQRIPVPPSKQPSAVATSNDIEARGFNFYYGAFKALDDISIAAPRQDITR